MAPFSQQPAIVTPHFKEFETLFNISIKKRGLDEKKSLAADMAKKYYCIILLKTVDDIISDGKTTVVVTGGNAGLTKGGTGDIIAGLTAAFYTKSESLSSAILASFLVKSAAESLFKKAVLWYNTSDVVEIIPALSKKTFCDNPCNANFEMTQKTNFELSKLRVG